MSTSVLVVGSGAREHALAWKLRQSPSVGDLFVAPGNPGTTALAENLPLDPMDFAAISAAARDRGVGLVVIGPETPLAAGLADHLAQHDIAVFGPSRAAAQIESSKSFAKQLMTEAAIPTARAEAFDDYASAVAYVQSTSAPPVVKADGLAAGKGVTVSRDTAEAIAALKAAMIDGVHGEAGRRVVIEERLQGREVSTHAFTDGMVVRLIPCACDHKAIWDGDRGPNTGGMGAFSPPLFVDAEFEETVRRSIVEPAIQLLAGRGMPYRGMLYPGLMLTDTGPRVVEFNCRFGDPETQVILPRLRSDFFEPIWGAAAGSLAHVCLDWSDAVAIGVVLAAQGYPGAFRRGDPIHGLDELDPDILVFHAGTAVDEQGRLVTAGGRVLTVVAMGPTIEAARTRAYANVARIRFEGMQFRKDIGIDRPQ